MKKPPLPPSFSWQFLPASPMMDDVRNCGRCLKRWGTRHGFRTGTTNTEKARILAARWIHIHTTPHTQRSDLTFNDQIGAAWAEDKVPTMETHQRAFNPYTLAMIGGQCEAAFREIAATTIFESFWRGTVLDKFDEPVRHVGSRGFAEVAPFVLALYRSIVTVSADYTPSAQAEADFAWLADFLAVDAATVIPVKTDSPWQIAAQPPAQGMTAFDWFAADFNAQFLC